MKSLLLFLLVVTGLVPFSLGVLSFKSYTMVLDFLAMDNYSDSFQLTAVAGFCMIVASMMNFIAAYLIFHDEEAGTLVSNFVCYSMFFAAFVIFSVLHRTEAAALYAGVGLVILVLTALYKRSSVDEKFKTD